MYVRFVTLHDDTDSQEPMGIFAAAINRRRNGEILALHEAHLHEILVWFGSALQIPARLNRSRRPHRINKAISWFKPTATDHISKAREIVAILEEHGEHVRMFTTQRPGYIVYEDEFQIVAEPYASTDR